MASFSALLGDSGLGAPAKAQLAYYIRRALQGVPLVGFPPAVTSNVDRATAILLAEALCALKLPATGLSLLCECNITTDLADQYLQHVYSSIIPPTSTVLALSFFNPTITLPHWAKRPDSISSIDLNLTPATDALPLIPPPSPSVASLTSLPGAFVTSPSPWHASLRTASQADALTAAAAADAGPASATRVRFLSGEMSPGTTDGARAASQGAVHDDAASPSHDTEPAASPAAISHASPPSPPSPPSSGGVSHPSSPAAVADIPSHLPPSAPSLSPRMVADRSKWHQVTSPVTRAAAAALVAAIYGSSRGAHPTIWKSYRQGFYFTHVVPMARFGLVQREGGPCGVIAAVNAQLIAMLRADTKILPRYAAVAGALNAPAPAPAPAPTTAPPPPSASTALAEGSLTVIPSSSSASSGLHALLVPADGPHRDPPTNASPRGLQALQAQLAAKRQRAQRRAARAVASASTAAGGGASDSDVSVVPEVSDAAADAAQRALLLALAVIIWRAALAGANHQPVDDDASKGSSRRLSHPVAFLVVSKPADQPVDPAAFRTSHSLEMAMSEQLVVVAVGTFEGVCAALAAWWGSYTDREGWGVICLLASVLLSRKVTLGSPLGDESEAAAAALVADAAAMVDVMQRAMTARQVAATAADGADAAASASAPGEGDGAAGGPTAGPFEADGNVEYWTTAISQHTDAVTPSAPPTPSFLSSLFSRLDEALVVEHGYCSQAVISLLLVATPTPHLHDGDIALEAGVQLRGIPSRSDVGFVTLFEAYGYVRVGRYLKRPRVGVWVVCSQSHYSVLFVDDASIADDGAAWSTADGDGREVTYEGEDGDGDGDAHASEPDEIELQAAAGLPSAILAKSQKDEAAERAMQQRAATRGWRAGQKSYARKMRSRKLPPSGELATFLLRYYDALCVESEVPITVTQRLEALPPADAGDLMPPLQHVIGTRWGPIDLDWHGAEPLL